MYTAFPLAVKLKLPASLEIRTEPKEMHCAFWGPPDCLSFELRKDGLMSSNEPAPSSTCFLLSQNMTHAGT